MGLKFGQLNYVRGIIFYKISPFEQRAFAGSLTKGFPNFIRMVRENIFVAGIPTVAAYLLYDWADKTHYKSLRKNPADFENDE